MHDIIMPPVKIRYRANALETAVAILLRKEVLRKKIVMALLPAMCETIARQLTCELDNDEREETGQESITVTPEMVKVDLVRVSKRNGIRTKDLQVDIEARGYKARQLRKGIYAEELKKVLLSYLPKGTSISVWYKLLPAAWSDGEA
jgi:hypothetical protein